MQLPVVIHRGLVLQQSEAEEVEQMILELPRELAHIDQETVVLVAVLDIGIITQGL